MPMFPLGFIIATAAFVAAILHLKQDFTSYYDLVALLMVFGGTVSVGVILIPWNLRADLRRALRDLIMPSPIDTEVVLRDCLQVIRTRQASGLSSSDSVHVRVLREGIELMELGFSAERIDNILSSRVRAYGARRRKIANAIKSLAKYPPAFGLMGTVLGLVNVMRGVSTGGDSKQTALEMALALVATMYGLIIANLVVNPAGEYILRRTSEEESIGDIGVEAIHLLATSSSLLESQEVLNSLVPQEDRIDVVGNDLEAAA